MQTLKWKVLIMICMLAVSVADAWAFDKERGDEIVLPPRANYTFVRVVTIGRAITIIRDEEGRMVERETMYQIEGSGFVAKEGDIITDRHVIYPKDVQTTVKPGSLCIAPVERILSREILVSPYDSAEGLIGAVPVSVLYESEAYDVALLSYGEDYSYLQPVQYDFAKTWKYGDEGKIQSRLEVGDQIAVIVRNRVDGVFTDEVEVRYGVIKNPGPEADAKELPWFNLEDFTMEKLDVTSGDSGSIVIAWEGGKPVVVGVYRASRSVGSGILKSADPTGYKYAVRIDRINFHLSVER